MFRGRNVSLEADRRLQRLTSIRDFMNGEFPCWIDQKAWYLCTITDEVTRSSRLIICDSGTFVHHQTSVEGDTK